MTHGALQHPLDRLEEEVRALLREEGRLGLRSNEYGRGRAAALAEVLDLVERVRAEEWDPADWRPDVTYDPEDRA